MLKHLLNKHRLEVFVVLFLIVVAVLYFSNRTYAGIPRGSTLNPDCPAGDLGCTVDILETIDEVTSLTTNTLSYTFKGDGVEATNSNGAVSVTIPGGGAFEVYSEEPFTVVRRPIGANYANEDFVFGSPTLDYTDQGARMFFDKGLAAFRAGETVTDYWNSGNIGRSSVAMGQSTLARGLASTAMGQGTTAGVNDVDGVASTAMGSQTTATGDYSTAMGYNTTASNEYSTAMGGGTTASGKYSTAMGYNTLASGPNSTAMGNLTEASGDDSTAMGQNTTARGMASTAMGQDTDAAGFVSIAMGYQTTAAQDYSTAMGYGIKADATGAFGINLNPDCGVAPCYTIMSPKVMSIMGGNVGIGTVSPGSRLELEAGSYLRLSGGDPPASECDVAAENGRLAVDTTNGKLYVCDQVGSSKGWAVVFDFSS